MAEVVYVLRMLGDDTRVMGSRGLLPASEWRRGYKLTAHESALTPDTRNKQRILIGYLIPLEDDDV